MRLPTKMAGIAQPFVFYSNMVIIHVIAFPVIRIVIQHLLATPRSKRNHFIPAGYKLVVWDNPVLAGI